MRLLLPLLLLLPTLLDRPTADRPCADHYAIEGSVKDLFTLNEFCFSGVKILKYAFCDHPKEYKKDTEDPKKIFDFYF